MTMVCPDCRDEPSRQISWVIVLVNGRVILRGIGQLIQPLLTSQITDGRRQRLETGRRRDTVNTHCRALGPDLIETLNERHVVHVAVSLTQCGKPVNQDEQWCEAVMRMGTAPFQFCRDIAQHSFLKLTALTGVARPGIAAYMGKFLQPIQRRCEDVQYDDVGIAGGIGVGNPQCQCSQGAGRA